MIDLDNSQLLIHIIESMQDQANKLELAENRQDEDKIQNIKKFILKMQQKIDEILEISKK